MKAAVRLALVFLCFVCVPALAVAPGQKAPELLGKSMVDGREIKLSDLRGKVVYLDFWATWCAPCLQSLPRLVRMREDLAPGGFEVLGVNLDEKVDAAERLMQTLGIHYPVVRGVDTKTITAYEIVKMPASYLIDRDGVVNFEYFGYSAAGFDSMRRRVEALVRTAPAQ